MIPGLCPLALFCFVCMNPVRRREEWLCLSSSRTSVHDFRRAHSRKRRWYRVNSRYVIIRL